MMRLNDSVISGRVTDLLKGPKQNLSYRQAISYLDDKMIKLAYLKAKQFRFSNSLHLC